jgi:endonuclease III
MTAARKTPALSLTAVAEGLRSMYGTPPKPLPKDVYEAALWECVAYLVDDERRKTTFLKLRREIGLDPAAILGAPMKLLLAAIEDGGMLPAHRAEKVRKAAAIAAEVGRGEIQRLARESPKEARRVLKRFPGIADPGADWLLLLAHGQRSLAPDSNALRVLNRLGYGEEVKDYTKSYRSAAAAVASELPSDYDDLISLRQLLPHHGQETCNRSGPACDVCALAPMCRFRNG